MPAVSEFSILRFRVCYVYYPIRLQIKQAYILRILFAFLHTAIITSKLTIVTIIDIAALMLLKKSFLSMKVIIALIALTINDVIIFLVVLNDTAKKVPIRNSTSIP